MEKKNEGEFGKFISAEIKEIEKYVESHPEMKREDAVKEWIKKHAAEYRNNYENR